MFTKHAVLLLLATPFLTSALGINCRGSSDCVFGTHDQLGPLIDVINKMNDNTCVTPGQKIGCIDGGITDFCAFTQKTSNKLCGADIKKLLGDLKDHGCGTCGSVPLGFPATNDDNNGELTVNAVHGGGCRAGGPDESDETGLCPGVN